VLGTVPAAWFARPAPCDCDWQVVGSMNVRITASPSHGMVPVARVDSESGIVGTGSRSVSRHPCLASHREPEGPRAPQLEGDCPRGAGPGPTAGPRAALGGHWPRLEALPAWAPVAARGPAVGPGPAPRGQSPSSCGARGPSRRQARGPGHWHGLAGVRRP
jgi:hypothetical protein